MSFSYDQTVYHYYTTVVNLSHEYNYMQTPSSSTESLSVDVLRDPDVPSPGVVPNYTVSKLQHAFSKVAEYFFF